MTMKSRSPRSNTSYGGNLTTHTGITITNLLRPARRVQKFRTHPSTNWTQTHDISTIRCFLACCEASTKIFGSQIHFTTGRPSTGDRSLYGALLVSSTPYLTALGLVLLRCRRPLDHAPPTQVWVHSGFLDELLSAYGPETQVG